jgi:serine/threonine protein kinase
MLPTNAGVDLLETQLRQACADLARRLYAGEACRAETVFEAYPDLASQADSALELIYSTEFVIRLELGERPSFEEYYERFPQWQGALKQQFQVHELLDNPASGAAPETWPSAAAGDTLTGWDAYELLGKIGHGPNGTVYKARNIAMDRVEIVKVIAGGDSAPPEDLARLLRSQGPLSSDNRSELGARS